MKLGTSLIPKIGIQTQNIPPKTSVKESNVRSAAGKNFDLEAYKIIPVHTKKPCNVDNEVFLIEISRSFSEKNKTITENSAQKIPAIATVVNFGVSFRHLSETVNPANPKPDNNPFTKPNSDLSPLASSEMKIIPRAAIIIENKVVLEIFSFKKKYASNAAIKGIAAILSIVTAAVVDVNDKIKVIFATPRLIPPINPDKPIL